MLATPPRVIVPAAGYGSRLRPLTYAIPKEMLPVGRKTVLDYVMAELFSSGLREVLIILSPLKNMIREYLKDGASLGMHIEYACQEEMRGLGDAILKGEEWVGGHSFVVAFGDCIISSNSSHSPLNRMLQCHESSPQTAITLCETVDADHVHRYGILDPAYPANINGVDPFPLRDIIEKPSRDLAPSHFAVAARWILPPGIFPFLHEVQKDPCGEINLTDAVRNWMRSGGETWAVPLSNSEKRWDIGGWESYFKASIHMILSDEEYGERIKSQIA